VNGKVDPDDIAGALGLATTHLHSNLQTVRAHFGMDENEAAP
jgi:Holliday junction resolvasome RuvABC endonuclease subunit